MRGGSLLGLGGMNLSGGCNPAPDSRPAAACEALLEAQTRAAGMLRRREDRPIRPAGDGWHAHSAQLKLPFPANLGPGAA